VPPAFVLLHGIAATANGWDEVAGRLVDAGRAAYAIDFRGHGESDRPDTGYDLPTFASDVVAALSGLGVERPILAGHSLGANVALAVESAHPGMVGGIALVEGGLVDASEQFSTLDECVARMALAPVAGMPLPRLTGYLRATNPGWSAERLAATLSAFDVAPDGTVKWRLASARYQSLLHALWEARASDAWSNVSVPLLVAIADNGDAGWTAVKRVAETKVRAAVSTARIEWFTADHDLHADRPDEIARLLLDAFPAR
jgi:pimeloyl-ACP methyl ester carboxylesterase